MSQRFFWLHIKKAGGTSMRQALGEAYPQVDRKHPQPFISLPKEYWNDNLNNYRVPLGKYDFRRALFAKRFLYTPKEWDNMFKFCIVRNPFARVVSAYEYLIVRERRLYPLRLLPKQIGFLRFLRMLSPTLVRKVPRHRATHIAPIYPDISDESGNNLMDYCIRIEQIAEDLCVVSDATGLNLKIPQLNSGRKSREYRHYYTDKARKIVTSIYYDDLDRFNYTF